MTYLEIRYHVQVEIIDIVVDDRAYDKLFVIASVWYFLYKNIRKERQNIQGNCQQESQEVRIRKLLSGCRIEKG